MSYPNNLKEQSVDSRQEGNGGYPTLVPERRGGFLTERRGRGVRVAPPDRKGRFLTGSGKGVLPEKEQPIPDKKGVKFTLP